MVLDKLTIDFETASRSNLRKVGVSRYAQDPSTRVQCISFTKNHDVKNVATWFPPCGVAAMSPNAKLPPVPSIVWEALEEGWEFHAHNAGFETYIWHYIMHLRHGWPDVPADKWRCTAAKAAHANMARSLEELGTWLGLAEVKDKAGAAVMKKMMAPRKPTKKDPREWIDDAESHQILRAYNRQDVITEIKADEKLPEWLPAEQEVWLLDQRINRRGIPVDVELCKGAVALFDRSMAIANEKMSVITGGVITKPTQAKRIVQWANKRGVNIGNLKEGTVKDMLALDSVPEDVKEVLRVRQQSGSAAVKKYSSTLACADDDGRARELLLYCGAGTGRWSGKRLQPHNFKRGLAAPDDLVATIASGDWDLFTALYEERDVINLLKSAVKSIILAPPKKKLVISDFSGIEARVLQWLAGNEVMCQQFRNGDDIYVDMACKIFKCKPGDIIDATSGKPFPDKKYMRQIGKVAILGLGYGMGWEKYIATLWNQERVKIDEKTARDVVEIFRESNPLVTNLWKRCEKACVLAIKEKRHIRFGRLEFKMQGQYLMIRLPSGRWLHYFQPKLVKRPGFYSDSYEITYLQKKGRQKIYGGLIVENIVQAIARDLLVDAMFRIERGGLDLIMHVHDEVVVEVDEDREHEAEKFVDDAMTTVADWAKGCPVGAETHTSKRYTK